MATATTRKVNVQPNHLPVSLALSVVLDGTIIGAIGVPQGELLSEKGNVVYGGGIRKGLRFPQHDDAVTALKALTFQVNDHALSAGDVHLSAPRTRKDGATYGGGNPTVCHTAIIPLSDEQDYTVQVFCTFLGEEKGFNLNVKAFKRPVNVGGPQVVGSIVGLTIE